MSTSDLYCKKKKKKMWVWVSQDALFRLEPYGGKLTCAVLRGTRSLVTGFWGGNAPRLPDLSQIQAFYE